MELPVLEKVPSSKYRVRFQDCDPMGHLNNSRYIDYVLNAREDHLESAYDLRLSDFIKQGYGWVVSSHEVAYLKPALYNEQIEIVTSLAEFGENHVLVEGLLYDSTRSQLKSILWTRYVFVSVRTGKKEKLTVELEQLFSQILNERVQVPNGIQYRLNELRK